ncbi:MAG: hypothetical protein ACRD82_03005 [Blastocatellia bacterium]
MKSKSSIALIIFACFTLVFAVSGCRMRSRSQRTEVKSSETETAATKAAEPQAELSINATEDSDDLPAKEEIRRKFQLPPNSRIYIHSINGKLTVETADTDAAEVLIVRSAQKSEDLENYRKVKIEQQENRLFIGIENDRKSLFSAIGKIPEGRQRVVLKIPRKVDFEANGINGNVAIAEILGYLELHGITGELKVARVTGNTDIDGVNGNVDVSFAPLKGGDIEINGINGNIDLRFEGEVNANLESWGINGRVNTEFPNAENLPEKSERGRLEARIGSGGTKIRIGGINGNVNFLKAGKAPAPPAKVASK